MKGASSSGNNFFPSSLLCILIFMSIFNRRFCELFSFFPGFLKITIKILCKLLKHVSLHGNSAVDTLRIVFDFACRGFIKFIRINLSSYLF